MNVAGNAREWRLATQCVAGHVRSRQREWLRRRGELHDHDGQGCTVQSVALILSVVGIYGVMAYYVQQHLEDISIRLALGGSSADVLRLIVGQGMTVVAGGVVVGLSAAVGLTRLMSSLLFGVGAGDPLTFGAVGLFLLTVALATCVVPAARAVGLQPATVLRNE